MKQQFGGRALLVAVFLLLVTSTLSAQTAGTGALSGTVTDASGAAIPKGTVTVTNIGNGQSRTTATETDGTYKFNLLTPGTYRVRFEAPGFTSIEVPSIDVAVTETPVLDRSLAVGSQAQQITVTGEVETIQAASSALGSVVNARVVTDLPLSTRNYTNLLAMSAGTNADVNNATSLGRGWQFTSVNGANDTQNNFQMDGAPINDWASFNVGDGAGYFAGLPVPNPDAIQEFKIQTSNYDAGYGRNAGGNVNVITKAGTNSFHGTAFEFFRNSALNANDYFFNATAAPGAPKPVLNQNQFGGTFGGPIKKDKLFFFVSYQETRQKNGYSTYGLSTYFLPPIPGSDRGSCPAGWTTPSQCNAAAQAFISNLGTANCPPPGVASLTLRGGTQVLCNGSNINPVAINILQLTLPGGGYYIPSPVTLGKALPAAGSTTAITSSDPAQAVEHQFIGNWDYVVNSKNTLSGRFNYTADPTNAPFACGITGVASGCLPGGPVYFKYSSDAALLKLTSVLSNNVVNEARVSYQRFQTVSTNNTPFTNAQVGIQGFTPAVPQLTFLTITGGFVFGAHPFFGLNLPENQIQAAEQISWVRGKHSIRAGVEFAHNAMTLYLPSADRGQPTFPTFDDFLIGGCGVPVGCTPFNGTAFSNLSSVGPTTQFRAFNGQLNQTFLETSVNSFLQDDYKLTSRLTLNLGLRWEYDGFPYEKNGLYSNMWPSLLAQQPIPGTTQATGSLVGYMVPSNFPGPIPTGVYQSNHRSIAQGRAPLDGFAPRLGFAWQPLANSHFVVRGGAGIFYEQPSGEMITLLGSVPPYENTPALQPSATLANPFALAPTLPGPPGTPGWPSRWVNFATGQSSNLTYRSLGQNFTDGTVYEWNLNTQYEFLPTWVLELGYVGSHGINLMSAYPLTGQTQSNYPFINLARLASPTQPLYCGYDGVPADCVTTNTTANVATRVPYLGLGTGYNPLNSTAHYKFNSLQVTVRKQLSHGLQIQTAYTWARGFSDYWIGNPAATQPGIPPEVDVYGPNGAYRPQRLVFNYTWDIPNGNLKGFLGKITGGWNWSGVTTIQNGDPLVITDSRSGTIFSNSGGPVALATFCPGQGISNIEASGSVEQRVANGLLPLASRSAGTSGYFNTGVFCAPQAVGNGFGYGGAPLGSVQGPGQNNWDMSLAKTIPFTEAQALQFRTEFFNTFNRPQFLNPLTNAALPSSFGQIQGTSVSPRLIQFALKYVF